ncbi:hypothetical protein IF2G_08433 [Cordyceps javanica]|nr:hypothetical protein IF2G_08433 [Cordyceps javanica]
MVRAGAGPDHAHGQTLGRCQGSISGKKRRYFPGRARRLMPISTSYPPQTNTTTTTTDTKTLKLSSLSVAPSTERPPNCWIHRQHVQQLTELILSRGHRESVAQYRQWPRHPGGPKRPGSSTPPQISSLSIDVNPVRRRIRPLLVLGDPGDASGGRTTGCDDTVRSKDTQARLALLHGVQDLRRGGDGFCSALPWSVVGHLPIFFASHCRMKIWESM